MFTTAAPADGASQQHSPHTSARAETDRGKERMVFIMGLVAMNDPRVRAARGQSRYERSDGIFDSNVEWCPRERPPFFDQWPPVFVLRNSAARAMPRSEALQARPESRNGDEARDDFLGSNHVAI